MRFLIARAARALLGLSDAVAYGDRVSQAYRIARDQHDMTALERVLAETGAGRAR